jgi:paired amphipathic helix protein Sin3a
MRDRENRDRELMEAQEEAARREAEQREREMRERQQQHDAAALENNSGAIQIHQPVAVAPAVRTIHGPNGLLGNSATLGGSNALSTSLGTPNGPGNIFGSGTVQQGDTTPRMQHAVQPPQAQSSMLMPFGGPGMPGQLGMVQGQQPILNVSLLGNPF